MGICVYCLGNFPRLTDDHVLPRSWYPATTPANLAKPQVPCCQPCNHRFSGIEKDLLLRIAHCFGWHDLRAAGVPRQALRAIDPSAASTERERQYRERLRKRLYQEIGKTSAGPVPEGARIVPGFEPEPGADTSVRIPLAGESLFQFALKLVRGMTHWDTKRLVTPEYRIDSGLADGPGADAVIARFGAEAKSYGPGFLVTATRKPDDPVVSVLRFRLWDRLSIYATVSTEGAGEPWDSFAEWIDHGPAE